MAERKRYKFGNEKAWTQFSILTSCAVTHPIDGEYESCHVPFRLSCYRMYGGVTSAALTSGFIRSARISVSPHIASILIDLNPYGNAPFPLAECALSSKQYNEDVDFPSITLPLNTALPLLSSRNWYRRLLEECNLNKQIKMSFGAYRHCRKYIADFVAIFRWLSGC